MAKVKSSHSHHLTMRESFFINTSALLFAFGTIMLGMAAAFGWQISVNSWAVPTWFMLLLTLVLFLLTYKAIQLLR